MFLLPLSDLPRTHLTAQVADLACRMCQDTHQAALPVPQQNVGQVTRTGGRQQGSTREQMCEWHLLTLKVCFSVNHEPLVNS